MNTPIKIFVNSVYLILATIPFSSHASTLDEYDGADYFHDRTKLETIIENGEYKGAYALVQRLNDYNPNDSLQWWTQGWLAEQLKLWNEAGDAFAHSLSMGSFYEAQTARRIAEAYAKAGRDEDVYKWLEKAIALGIDKRYNLVDNAAFRSIADSPRFLRIAGLVTKPMKSRSKRWHYDLDFLVSEAQRMNANPKQPALRPAFLNEALQVRKNINSQTDTEMSMSIQRLVVLLGDGHTYVRAGFTHEKGLQPASLDARELPVVFHPFGEDIYIINATDDGIPLIGGRVISIGGVSTKDFINLALPYIHSDNAESWKFLGVHFSFRRLAFLQALDVANNDKVQISVIMPDGETREKELKAGNFVFPRGLRAMPRQTEIAKFLGQVDTQYWGELLADKNAYYTQINKIRDDKNGENLASFVTHATDKALHAGVQNLIYDFRLNNGGNSTLCDAVVKQALRFESASKQHKVFVITRHQTFSAAQNCTSRIERLTRAFFVGEPSSSSPNFTGEESEIMLPYSGLVISISNRYWQNSSPIDNRPWIEMDIPVTLTFEDFRQGRDRALEAIFNVLTEEEDLGKNFD